MMCKRFSMSVAAVVALCCIASCSQRQVGNFRRDVAPGVEHIHESVAEGPWSIHVLKVDLSRRDLHWVTALGAGHVFGLSTVSEMVHLAAASAGGRLVAAINGDFFAIRAGDYQGDPLGIQIMNGELVSGPRAGYGAFWMDAEGKPHMWEVESHLRARWPGGEEVPFVLNEGRPDGGAALYSPVMGFPARNDTLFPSTRTRGGRELVLERVEGQPWLPVEVGKRISARVREVRDAGNTPLEADALILSLGPGLLAKTPPAPPGTVLTLIFETTPDLSGVRCAVGGGTVLVKNGAAQYTEAGPESPRHPRTFLGWNEQHLFAFVVDGRQSGFSVGMTYAECAALALRYGCTEALELDGGGSSTMWVAGKVVNSPSDRGGERSVGNALILIRSKGGEPEDGGSRR